MNAKLQFNKYYHIYNKGNGNEKLFLTEKDYKYFLLKFQRFISPIAETFAYCLIPNHFHFLIKIKEEFEIQEYLNQTGCSRLATLNDVNRPFSNFFNSYSKSFNKVHNRSSKLFKTPFNKILINKEEYFTYLIYYIHRNPIHHKLSNDLESWKYSSYKSFLTNTISLINKDEVLKWFSNKEDFLKFHNENVDLYKIEHLIVD